MKPIQSGKIRVAFFVYLASIWDSHRSVYEAMKEDDAFEVMVILAPTLKYKKYITYQEDIYEFFKKQDIDVILGVDNNCSILDISTLKIDVLFYQTPFYMGIREWDIDNMIQHTRVAYIPYGLYIAGIQQVQFNLLFHNMCWKLFAETPMHKALYARYKDSGDSNVIVSGYPKFDAYKDPTLQEQGESCWKISAKEVPEMKRIIWSPHWVVHEETKYTSFVEYLPFFISYLKQNPHIEIVLKPHPVLFETLIDKGVYTQDSLNEILAEFSSLPNASIFIGGDYFKLFCTSDAMINSSISFLAEYLPTKKPMLFLPNINDLGCNEFGEQIKKLHYQGYSIGDIEHFIADVVIAGVDTMYDTRMQGIQEFLYFPEISPGYKIKEEIKQSIFTDNEWKRKQERLKIQERRNIRRSEGK